MGTFWTILGGVFGVVGNVVKTVADATTARMYIAGMFGSRVMTAAMNSNTYWVVWGIAAVPMAAWFGWGMLDTLANGALPDVAAIPPGLLPWAEIVWANIFWTGLAGWGVSKGVGLIGRILGR